MRFNKCSIHILWIGLHLNQIKLQNVGVITSGTYFVVLLWVESLKHWLSFEEQLLTHNEYQYYITVKSSFIPYILEITVMRTCRGDFLLKYSENVFKIMKVSRTTYLSRLKANRVDGIDKTVDICIVINELILVIGFSSHTVNIQ